MIPVPAAILAVLLCVQPADPRTPAPPAPTDQDPALIRELEEIDARAADVHDLSADFEQEKFTPVLKKPLVSSGRVRVVPPRIRWDTDEPHPSVLLLSPEELRLYDPEARTLEIVPVSGGLSQAAASPLPRLATVRDHFGIERADPATLDEGATEASSIAVRLLPRDESVAEHVAEVRVLIDRALACATRVEITDADGDRTVIRFRRIRLNSGVRDVELDLAVPAGTTISRPAVASPGPEAKR